MAFYFSKHFCFSNPLSQSLEPAPLSFQKIWHLSEIEILKMESPKSYLNSLKSLVFRQILRKLSEFRWNNVYLAFFVKFLHLDIQETKVINLILSLEECTVTTDFKCEKPVLRIWEIAWTLKCENRIILLDSD